MTQVTIETGDGRSQMEVTSFSPQEREIFDREYPLITRLYSQYLPGSVIDSFFNDPGVKAAILLAAQNAKSDIQPSSGTFGGMGARTGFGWQPIRADYMVPTAQGRTFETAVSGLTAQSYYGLWHNAAIGGAYNTTPLYLRKEVAVIIVGLIELSGNPIAEAIQFELNTQPMSIHTLNWHMLGGDKPVYFFPRPYYLRPSGRYRSQFQSSVAAGTFNLQPIGMAFPSSENMLLTTPTQPSVTAP